jgi:hypothetical protein
MAARLSRLSLAVVAIASSCIGVAISIFIEYFDPDRYIPMPPAAAFVLVLSSLWCALLPLAVWERIVVFLGCMLFFGIIVYVLGQVLHMEI